jgi:transposase-like protein
MTEAWKQNKKMPNQIITDRLPSYQDGIRKTFRNWGNERKIKHTSIVGKRKIVNNNAVENLHTHQKEFQKVRRGIKEVQNYSDGFKVYHNFIRKGVKDKLSPAERCGIMVNENRWNTLLLNSLSQVPNLTGEQNIVKSP